MGGHHNPHEREFYQQHTYRNGHTLGRPQIAEAQPASTFPLHGYCGCGSQRHLYGGEGIEPNAATHDTDHRAVGTSIPVMHSHQGAYGTLHQTRGADTTGSACAEWKPRPEADTAHGEAPGPTQRLPTGDSDISAQRSAVRAAPAHARRHHPIVGMHFKRRHYSTQRDLDMPLHVAEIAKIDYQKVLSIATPVQHALLAKLLRFVEDETLYTELCTQPVSSLPGSIVNHSDMQQMLTSGNFESTRKLAVKRIGKVFDRPEHEKNRRRVLYWPKLLNTEIDHSPFAADLSPELVDAATHAKHLQPGEYAATFDLAKSFLQCPLSTAVRPYFTYRVKGKYYRLTSLPMGATFAPALMHSITEILASTGVPGVTAEVHIDNIRLRGELGALQQAIQQLRYRARSVNATLKEEPCNEPHTQGTFLGCFTDYTNATIKLSTRIVEKLRTEAQTLDNAQATMEDAQVLFGLTLFAARVHRHPMAQFYPIVKFMRRRLATIPQQHTHTEMAKIWPCIKPEWKYLIASLLENLPTHHQAPTAHETVLVTDASLTGWGAVWFDEDTGEVLQAHGKWDTPHQPSEINELEMQALRYALDTFSDTIQAARPLLILMDNSSAVHTLAKGSAHAFKLNKEALSVLERLPTDASVKVGYVESANNPADAASRGLTADLTQLPSDCWSLGRRLAGSAVQVTVPSRSLSPGCQSMNVDATLVCEDIRQC